MRERFWAWFVKGMKNGLKLQIAISILILGGVIALYLQFRAQFGDHDPDIAVAGVTVQEPVDQGGVLTWARTLCNDSDHIVDVVYSLHLLSADLPEREETIPGNLSASVTPGCGEPQLGVVKLPETIDPGRWRLRLLLYYTPSGGLITLVSGTSAPFEIRGEQ